MVFWWGQVPETVTLFFIPAGLVTMAFGGLPGSLTAAALTLLFTLAPGPFASAGPALRVMAILSIWSVVGLIWLTLRPLLSAVEWSWRAYWQSSKLLEQAREFQAQFQQAFEDLTQANLQLKIVPTRWLTTCAVPQKRNGGSKSSLSPTSATSCARRSIWSSVSAR